MMLGSRLILFISDIFHVTFYRTSDSCRNDRFGHIIIHTHFVTLINIVLVVEQLGNDDDHLVLVIPCSYVLDYIPAVHFWHHQV